MPLIKCPECGFFISERATSCPHCGRPMTSSPRGDNPRPQPQPFPPTPQPQPQPIPIGEDKSNVGLNILSFLFPLVGWILYFVHREKYPIKAKACSLWAWIGFGVNAFFYVIALSS